MNIKNDIESFKASLDLYGKDMTLGEFHARKAGRIDSMEVIRSYFNELPKHLKEDENIQEIYLFILGNLSEDVEL